MLNLPQRTSLVAQVAKLLRTAILEGQWPRWLPGELELTRRLRVGRVTLRAALSELEREKLITSGQGRRREILRKPTAGGRPLPVSRVVGLLTPEPLHRLSTSAVFWMDELRGYLDADGWPLEVHESAVAYKRRPAHALEEMVARVHPAGWVLYRSTPEMQRWFSDRRIPAVIAGSRHPEVALPSIDVDYGATCRHAAGRFRANGHHRIAIVRPDSKLAGDLQSVAGFNDGFGAEVPSVAHDGSVRGICQQLDRLFAQQPSPTGLFIFHAPHLLTVLGYLHGRGLRVPQDVSLLCRDDEPFLDSVVPSPARYALNPKQFARKLSLLVSGLLSGSGGRPRQLRILPDFVRGETLGRARD